MNNELDNLFKDKQKNPYITFGYLKNPFPTNATESYKICYNQENVKKIFINKLRSYILNQNIETLLINAEHRVGKTNFLLHYYEGLKDAEDNKLFKCVYIRNYGDNYLTMHKALVEMLGEDFFIDLLNKIKDKKVLLEEISDTDLKRGLSSIIRTPTLFGFDPKKISIFYEWFFGLKCKQNELQKIDVFSNITTSSLAIRYLKDLIKISRSVGLMNGLVIFMDEFELVFGASVSRAKRDKYLQDLRSLIDEIQNGIFIVCAITPGALVEMSKNYQALKARFGESVSLSPIHNIDEAQAYAEEYLKFARQEYQNKFKDKESKKLKTINIIESDEIIKIYKDLASLNPDQDWFLQDDELIQKELPGIVNQGFFFEKLHNYIEEKIAKIS